MKLKGFTAAPAIAGLVIAGAALSAASTAASTAVADVDSDVQRSPAQRCQIDLFVLGAGQDAGAPQIGNSDDAGPELLASSLAVVDYGAGKRYLFDATPDISRQHRMLDQLSDPPIVKAPKGSGLGIDGVFLTHAHIGHYLGLAFLGKEAANADAVTVHAMPRMAQFLRTNGPWGQLVSEGNITLSPLAPGALTVLSDQLGVVPIVVPHRDEYSETVGFLITTPGHSALYVPDLDSWDEFAEQSGSSLEQLIAGVDYAFLDATFWDDKELNGRDMSAIPHPRVSKVINRLQGLPADQRAKVQFIHYNHTNPIRDPASNESIEVRERGYHVARQEMRYCLSSGEG